MAVFRHGRDFAQVGADREGRHLMPGVRGPEEAHESAYRALALCAPEDGRAAAPWSPSAEEPVVAQREETGSHGLPTGNRAA